MKIIIVLVIIIALFIPELSSAKTTAGVKTKGEEVITSYPRGDGRNHDITYIYDHDARLFCRRVTGFAFSSEQCWDGVRPESIPIGVLEIYNDWRIKKGK